LERQKSVYFFRLAQQEKIPPQESAQRIIRETVEKKYRAHGMSKLVHRQSAQKRERRERDWAIDKWLWEVLQRGCVMRKRERERERELRSIQGNFWNFEEAMNRTCVEGTQITDEDVYNTQQTRA
jgi:hypothetical protein